MARPGDDVGDVEDLGGEDDDVPAGTVDRANGEPELTSDDEAEARRREGRRIERHGHSSRDPHVPIEPGATEPIDQPEPPETG